MHNNLIIVSLQVPRSVRGHHPLGVLRGDRAQLLLPLHRLLPGAAGPAGRGGHVSPASTSESVAGERA